MTDTLNISLAQQNPVLGDVEGNIAKIRKGRAEAKAQGADLVIYSELNVCGYPPEDLVLKPAFQEACKSAVTEAGGGDGRWRPGAAGGLALARGWQAVQRRRAAGSGTRGSRPLQMRSAQLRRVRREARVHAEPAPGAGEFPQCAARRHGLRGYVDFRPSPNAWRRPAQKSSCSAMAALMSMRSRRNASSSPCAGEGTRCRSSM